MKLGMAIEELHRSENDLTSTLLAMSDRHKTDHEVFYVTRDIAKWSREHVAELARVGRDYGLDLDPEAKDDPGFVASLRQKSSELMGRRPEPGLLLLADLRHLHRQAAGISLDWELLAQGAQAAKDRELLALSERCHPQTLRILRFANAKLKEASPQVLAS
ncbi:hypothetical protein [Modestobacter lapidis]|nr:hypothetical protein [Modestobacter lapidis]